MQYDSLATSRGRATIELTDRTATGGCDAASRATQGPTRWLRWIMAVVLIAPLAAPARADGDSRERPSADTILEALHDDGLRALAGEVLARNPEIAALAASARAEAEKAPQVGALPDPVLGVTAYLMSPQTRVGPQRGAVSVSQHLPWFGKLSLRERAATYEAAAARLRVDAAQLGAVTETRRLYYELAFLARLQQIVREDRDTLVHYEALARARYASGAGLEQGVVKIQAEITSADARLLDIASRRAALIAQLDALRDRPAGTGVAVGALPGYARLDLQREALHAEALQRRPEVAAADAVIEHARTLTELARKASEPDLTLGLTYGLVGKRTDTAGRTMPPEANGRDVLGVTAAINLPIRRQKLAAGVRQSVEEELAAEERKRALVASIGNTLGDLFERVPLTWERLRLFEDVLVVQAREALRSAESAYASGTATSLDLLDAERVLLQVRINTARSRADYAIAVAQLEGAVGVPIAEEPRS